MSRGFDMGDAWTGPFLDESAELWGIAVTGKKARRAFTFVITPNGIFGQPLVVGRHGLTERYGGVRTKARRWRESKGSILMTV